MESPSKEFVSQEVTLDGRVSLGSDAILVRAEKGLNRRGDMVEIKTHGRLCVPELGKQETVRLR
jgi:hypothetical protein